MNGYDTEHWAMLLHAYGKKWDEAEFEFKAEVLASTEYLEEMDALVYDEICELARTLTQPSFYQLPRRLVFELAEIFVERGL